MNVSFRENHRHAHIRSRPHFEHRHADGRSRPQFEEEFGERERLSHRSDPRTIQQRSSANPRRHSTYDPKDEYERRGRSQFSRRRHQKSRFSYDSFGSTSSESDWDPFMSSKERVLPSLAFDFNFQTVESPAEPKVSDSSKEFEQIGRKGTNGIFTKDYRNKLYHENVYHIIRSRYAGGRENSSIELCTNNAQDLSERGSTGLLNWMYDVSISQSVSTNIYP